MMRRAMAAETMPATPHQSTTTTTAQAATQAEQAEVKGGDSHARSHLGLALPVKRRWLVWAAVLTGTAALFAVAYDLGRALMGVQRFPCDFATAGLVAALAVLAVKRRRAEWWRTCR